MPPCLPQTRPATFLEHRGSWLSSWQWRVAGSDWLRPSPGELRTGLLGPWVWGPLIEELCKPAGVYLLLGRWPRALKNQAHIATLAGVAGLTFGLIESTLYVNLYRPKHSSSYVVLRFTGPVAMRTRATFVWGLGINRRLVESLERGNPFASNNWKFLLGAIVIHSVYNLTATVVEAVRSL